VERLSLFVNINFSFSIPLIDNKALISDIGRMNKSDPLISEPNTYQDRWRFPCGRDLPQHRDVPDII
jgi:hypothetical protein